MSTLRQLWARFGDVLTTAENWARLYNALLPDAPTSAFRNPEAVLDALLLNEAFDAHARGVVTEDDDLDATGTSKLLAMLTSDEYALQASADGRLRFVTTSDEVAHLELDFDPTAGEWVTRVDGRTDEGDDAGEE